MLQQLHLYVAPSVSRKLDTQNQSGGWAVAFDSDTRGQGEVWGKSFSEDNVPM